jgi:hypothetical protein
MPSYLYVYYHLHICFLYKLIIPLDVWSMAEMCTAIMVSSLPSLRPLLQKSRRFIISSSPSNSGDKGSSRDASKGNPKYYTPTIGSSSPQYKHEDSRDVELVHVGMKTSQQAQVQEREVEYNSTMHFQNKRANGRVPGDLV